MSERTVTVTTKVELFMQATILHQVCEDFCLSCGETREWIVEHGGCLLNATVPAEGKSMELTLL
jgi:hypothetical protein